jgi:hypothetical protein
MKKTKLKEYDFYTNEGYHYYDFCRMSVNRKRDGKRIYGTLYKLCKPLKNEEKEALLNKYNNVVLYIAQCQYAPEIKHNAVFVADHTIE